MILFDYRNPKTGEIFEVDVSLIPAYMETRITPKEVEFEGQTLERVYGKIAVHIPLHMQAKEDRHRFKFDKPPNGKKNLY
jgi:hypothetical protein